MPDAISTCPPRLDALLRRHLLLPAEIDALERALGSWLQRVPHEVLHALLLRLAKVPPAQRQDLLDAQLQALHLQVPRDASAALRTDLRRVLDIWLQALGSACGNRLLGHVLRQVSNRVPAVVTLLAARQADTLHTLLHAGTPTQWLHWWSAQPPVSLRGVAWLEAGIDRLPDALRTVLDQLGRQYLRLHAHALQGDAPVRLVLLSLACALATQAYRGGWAPRLPDRPALRRAAQLPERVATAAAAGSVLTTLFMPVVPPAMRVTHALPAAPPA